MSSILEPSSVDVAGSASTNPVESLHTPRPSPSAACTPLAEPRMVAPTHSLEDLVSHPASSSGQEKHYRAAQTAQDKRSRLSNVINNLRKKVPDTRSEKEEDDRNSVERNLETLEKYVMTVLNGVIKDEEDDDDRRAPGKEEKKKDEKLRERDEDEKSEFEPSVPNESRTEAAVLPGEESGQLECHVPHVKDRSEKEKDSLGVSESHTKSPIRELESGDTEVDLNTKIAKSSSREKLEEPDPGVHDSQEPTEERKESRSLGTLIMERLIEHQEDKNPENKEDFHLENAELRNICRDVLNDLLNGINQLIDENNLDNEDPKRDTSSEEKDSKSSQELSVTSLQCSLPLDKVASVLQNCQTESSPQSPTQGSKSPIKPPSPTVRHLCLYCDRKFQSISLRQRHTERVHQLGGGRRSERNSRKPSQNCQYCSDKCAESLEGLFQHMVGTHGDKYHACVQCATRYLTREALLGHLNESHGGNGERQLQDKTKEPAACKELVGQNPREKPEPQNPKERRTEEDTEHRTESIHLKPVVSKDFSNPGSPEFDSSFYSSVSCNIRENLLHHLDGKLQTTSSSPTTSTTVSMESKQPPPPQTFYEHNVNQIQFPIDISLTAATPVYSKEYATEDYENSSEYAQKPGKSNNRSHPRRVSFEKYNFPRKYDGKEQWSCSIKDLSKFDISTQLSLRKKQQLLKERITLNRLHQIPILGPSTITDTLDERIETETRCEFKEMKNQLVNPGCTEFSAEFGSFLRLRKWDESVVDAGKTQEVIYAELTGEWSRPRIYICGACASRHVTLREMEDHKAITHPNVWCSHFEFSGDQRDLYKHLFLPGRSVATAKARSAVLAETVCTKCSKSCNSLSELHRHMLECGGDQAWLLGLFGNGKKKCKWRPFGSRSRRRRQRGMKRNIQNSQGPRVNVPKEKLPTGPRVRPSDRESIQKMLANLPPKRATRKVLQDNSLRAQGRLRNVQTRSRPRLAGDNSTASRMSRNKAVLRNKLLKNAKSIQRNRCRSDNISAVIECVVRDFEEEKRGDERREERPDGENAKEKTETKSPEDRGRPKIARGPRVLGKRRNVRTKEARNDRRERIGHFKARRAKNTDNETAEKKVKLKKDTEEAKPSPEKSPSAKKSPTQTTPKKKRPVDPVASLNASLKAKSQLRTQDGKFARNPNKESSPQKSPEIRAPLAPGRQVSRARSNGNSPVLGVRSKLRTVHRTRNSDQLPKRTTRLSSDSDKMPTLEPAVQVSGDEYVEPSTNDLPILSPAAPSTEKLLRGKTSTAKTPDGERKTPNEDTEGSDKTPVQDEEKEQKQGKGRRGKSDAKIVEKDSEGESSKEGAKGKEKMKYRKSAPAKLNPEEKKEEKKSVTKTTEESKKEGKQKKEESKFETRSNSRAKISFEPEEAIKIQSVPFEVKKLIGSDSKEDLLTKLGLTSRDASSKRSLRQSVPRSKPVVMKNKVQKDADPDRNLSDSAETPRTSRKEKLHTRRKSPRNPEKKLEKDGTVSKDEKLEEIGKTRENETKTAVRGRRSSSLSGENKINPRVSPDRVKSDRDVSEAEVESVTQNGENENGNKRQTRGSLLNPGDETQNSTIDANDSALKKNTSLGKRRGRIKSSNEVPDKKNTPEISGKKTEEIEKNHAETTDRKEDAEGNQGKRVTLTEDNNAGKEKEEKANVAKTEKFSQPNISTENRINSDLVNLSLSQLQLETGSSMDSGKENSLETAATVPKLKVGRPKKSWGSKRERGSKRSLSNVIGILTEGMNIPVEVQQSVVLTVQTTLDGNPDVVQSNAQQPNDGNSANRPLGLDRVEKSSENDVVGVEAGSSDSVNEETPRDCVHADVEQLQTSDVLMKDLSGEQIQSQKDSCGNVAKEPANDIILDLSRRKQKGKGSFLEKIVSKIAKQKDALLEGEVGSLLDTAADELTSILDEVGPNIENADACEAKKSRSEKAKVKLQPVEVMETSGEICDTRKESVSRTRDEVVVSGASEIVELENLKKIPEAVENQDDTSTTANLVEEDHPMESHQENCVGSTIREQILSIEARSIPNGIRVPVNTDVPVNCPMQLEPSKEEEENKSVPEEEVITEKPKRRSKKRSLEGNSPKKNKRQSVDVTEIPEEVPDELQLADIMKLIEKSNRMLATSENDRKANENGSFPDGDGERVQPGKRKTINDDTDTKDATVYRMTENDYHLEHPDKNPDAVDGTKKLKVDTAESAGGKQAMDSINITGYNNLDNETSRRNEEENRGSSRATGKRKSYGESAEQYPEIDSQVRRSSKRRSLPEDKVSQTVTGDLLSKSPDTRENTVEVIPDGRRKSSRTKYVESRTEEEVREDEDNDTVSSIGAILKNTGIADDGPEEPVKMMEEKTEVGKDPPLILRIPEVSKIFDRSADAMETIKEDVNTTVLNDPVPPKVPKKRGRKKKCPPEEPVSTAMEDTFAKMDADSLEPVADKTIRKSTRANRMDTDEMKNPGTIINSQITSPSLEHFKIPEVTEVFQHTKKRTSKRKSTADEHQEVQTANSDAESIADCSDNSKTSLEKDQEDQSETMCQKETDNQKRLPRKAVRDQSERPERSSSSGSIDLSQSRTRSSKRKQLSSEDLSAQTFNHRAESVDNLSEASCASESSYFRKKRFSKKKKGFQDPEDVQTDTSVTDSESVDADKNAERRQSLKRRAKKNISFMEDHFDLVDDFDIPMDIPDLDSNLEVNLENGQNLEAKSDEPVAQEDDKTVENEPVEQEEEKTQDSRQGQDDFQTPKKRAAGNFVVVHKKTGEIQIVEKRKKLTKEAARFFCDMCATSFTRKSSLKKHNVSLSHLLLLFNSGKEKKPDTADSLPENDANWKISDEKDSDNPEEAITHELVKVFQEPLKNDDKLASQIVPENLPGERSPMYPIPMNPGSLIDAHVTRQDVLEDELLDEEICKITENMSHDEYVLTDHVSPVPEAASTPVKTEVTKVEETKKKKNEKKKDKSRKKNLADEHLILDTPEPEKPGDTTSDQGIAMKLSTSLTLNADPEPSEPEIQLDTMEHSVEPSVIDEESINNFSAVVRGETEASKLNREDFEMQVDQAVSKSDESVEMAGCTLPRYSDNEMSCKFAGDHDKAAEAFPKAISEADSISREDQAHGFGLRFTINKRAMDSPKGTDVKMKDLELNCPSVVEKSKDVTADMDCIENHRDDVEQSPANDCDMQIEPTDEINRTNADTLTPVVLNTDLPADSIRVTSSTKTADNVDNLDTNYGETQIPKIQEADLDHSENDMQENRQSVPTGNKEEFIMPKIPKYEGLVKTQHVKSKRNKSKKHLEESQQISIDSTSRPEDRSPRKSSKSKRNQNKHTEETPQHSEVIDHSESIKHPENHEPRLQEESVRADNSTDDLRSADIVEIDDPPVNKVESEIVREPDDPITAEQQFPNGVEAGEITPAEMPAGGEDEEEKQTDVGKKIESFLAVEDDEVSSSSSLADKPLLELLSRIDDKLETEGERTPNTSRNSPNVSEDSVRNPGDLDAATTAFDSDEDTVHEETSTGNEKSLEMKKTDSKASESECETAERSEKIVEELPGEKIPSEAETHPVVEDLNEDPHNVEVKVAARRTSQSIGKKVSKGHKSSGKESHRKSKASKTKKKGSSRPKMAGLSSASDDSDGEDKMESQNKSKIVKCVFGRVFGGEKTDKVKEVLNDWVSKSEDDSDVSRTEDRNKKRHSTSSGSSSTKKRSGRKSKKSSSSDPNREKGSPDSQEDHARKHVKPKTTSTGHKKHEEVANHFVSLSEMNELMLTSPRCRQSKKRAEERISRAFEDESPVPGEDLDQKTLKSLKHKDANYGLRNQGKPDLVKDSGYGSFNYDEEQSKDTDHQTEEQKHEKRRKSSSRKGKEENWKDLIIEKPTKPIDPSEEPLKTLQVDESSRSCSSLAPSSVRNRSPSLDRNSQSTHDSEVEAPEDLGHGRISPFFIRRTPRSSVSFNSDNEEPEEEETGKRSSSEFSGEKIVIRSPSATKGEVVTIAPTDAIEDNALDVPQIEKPRQGKVLNFDQELFVECCSRLKATTENELRGAKKIKLDHIESYHRKEDQQQGFRGTRDRWRDVESQNSLGSLLESVNQLLGEEMYTRERDYPKRRNPSESSRSASPDAVPNLGYEDSLDVAFEHNNKLRDKIQQRMRESENLIATFGQKSNDRDDARNYDPLNMNGYGESVRDDGKMMDNSGFKSKMNSALGGLLDKALSNLLHSNGKHDHNGSTPMKVLAELACARAPTSTSAGDTASPEDPQPLKPSAVKEIQPPNPVAVARDPKKPRNPIKELFERKKELNERKQQQSKAEAALRELNVHRQRKTKKTKKRQDFPLIRRGEHGGLAEKKKRRDGQERKEELASDRIKDVYDFDEEESQIEPNVVMSYRSKTEKGYEVSCLRTKEVDVAGLMSKAIGDTLENGKSSDALGTRLESMIDRKFKELETFAPKTKGALKAFQSEEQQRHVTGPMDEFIERKQQRSKRTVEQNFRQQKLKKRNKNPRKKTRNAWYENDSSDEYRTAVKAEDVGVGITKSQRTCSKGKQNLFAELSTSSESDLEGGEADYEAKRQRRVKRNTKKILELEDGDHSRESGDKFRLENADQTDEWRRDEELKIDNTKTECDNKKSESEMSDHPLVIDERKDDEQRNSDEDPENPYERNFGLDDLYREDTSVAESDVEEPPVIQTENNVDDQRPKSPCSNEEKTPEEKPDYMQEDELIPLEEALDLLDQADTDLNTKYEKTNSDIKELEPPEPPVAVEPVNESFDQADQVEETRKSPSPAEEPEEEQDDDLPTLPEKLPGNEKPQKESENLPLHVFLSRKVQESKKRKEQQLKKMQEEQERILMDFQPTRRQRKCAIGKQGLLAEISSSDEEVCTKDSRRSTDKTDHERQRKQKRESKEKRKERYIEKKHDQMIAKEQKAIEEEILRELGKKKEGPHSDCGNEGKVNSTTSKDLDIDPESPVQVQQLKKKHQVKEKQKKPIKIDEDHPENNNDESSDVENNCNKPPHPENHHENDIHQDSPTKQKKHTKSPVKPKRTPKMESRVTTGRKSKTPNAERKNRSDVKGAKDKERRSSSGRRDSDDEELKTTKSWNKVEEGVGVAIGRRKRAAANQLYYWSSSSDEEEVVEVVPVVEEEEDDRQEQHGWIVGDSHKRMITMLAMEKQLKEKRRRSEDEFDPGRAKSKKHRNSTS